MESTDYKVQLEIFEGPLDLLLYLIKQDEVDIYDVSIERLAKQYLGYIDTFKMLNISLASEFIVMAANLIYIKSRTLLPKHQQPPESAGAEDDDDPRWDLIRQLIEYKKFKDAAGFLHRREIRQHDFFANLPDEIKPRAEAGAERPLADVGVFDLIRAFQNVLDRFHEEDNLGEIVDERFTISDKIDYLLAHIAPGDAIPFSSLFESATTKAEVLVTFLALLELMKVRHFRARQADGLGEIELQRTKHL